MKILITGGAGFIGSHITELLTKKNFEVVIIDDLSSGRKDNLPTSCKFYNIDLLSPYLEEIFLFEKPDFIIHHAAQVSVAESMVDPEKDASINIIGTIRLLSLAIKYNVKKIIYSSSCAVYAESDKETITESSLISPKSFYGLSKYVSEIYIRKFHLTNQLPYTIFRYGNVYGPRQGGSKESGVIPIFINCAINKKAPIIFGDGKQTRDFIYVKDVAKANFLALENGDNEIFNLGTNTETSINSLWKKISALSGFNHPPIYVDKRIGDVRFSMLANEKAKEILKWTPEYSLNKGIAETIKYYMRG